MTKKEKENAFNLETELNAIQEPDWVKKAFVKTIDVSKIKSKNDLEKEFKKYMELK